MRDYEEVLRKVKLKIDRRMETNNPSSNLYEACASDENGNYEKDALDFDERGGWTRSFLTGAVAYMYFHFKEEKYLDYLKKELPVYKKYLRDSRSYYFHDIGFLFMLCSGAAYEVSKDETAYEINIKAADDFLKGYVPNVGMFDGFGGGDWVTTNPIIDDMMNTTILLWAWKVTGHPFYFRLYDNHIKKVRQYMLREDYTYRHSYLFDSNTGEPIGERNFCGFAPGSIWARGQMWAFYSTISALKATEDIDKYGDFVNGQLLTLLSMMGEDKVPLWDFKCLTENSKMKDSSAAAVYAAALLKIDEIDNVDKIFFSGEAKKYNIIGEEVLDELIDNYMYGDNCDACLKGAQVGTINRGAVWGDYFFIEALVRKIHGKDCPDFFVSNIKNNN